MPEVALKAAVYKLSQYYPTAGATEKVILRSAMIAAGADLVGGAIPGLAIPATIISCFGTVWIMYGQLCSKLGISLKENVLKLLARAVLANIAANLGGAIAALLAGMLIPGASIVVSAVVAFLTIYLAGLVFLRLIASLAEKSSDRTSFSDISTHEMKKTAREMKVGKEDLEEAKKAYAENKAQ
ncbi:MAG: hypothetical protein IKQ45_07465 [Clostridia bacterium]|nr:hypothetical protein [Clostridia bacterium]